MPEKICVVAIDMNRNLPASETTESQDENKHFYDYYRKHPQANLSQLEKVIRKICADLANKEPDAKWLIVWPEHGLGMGGHLEAEAKEDFKMAMMALTEEYKQLAIIAGTVMTSRQFDMDDEEQKNRFGTKAEAVKGAYAKNRWVATDESSGEYLAHEKEAEKESHQNKSEVRNIVRNTCYVFLNGECSARHDKIAPYKETGIYKQSANALFQPGKARNLSAHISLEFEDGVIIPIGVEICREHSVGVLKRQCDEAQHERPRVHFVVSDSIETCQDNIYGDYFVHVDTDHPVRMLRSHGDKSEADISGYCYRMFDEAPALVASSFETVTVKVPRM